MANDISALKVNSSTYSFKYICNRIYKDKWLYLMLIPGVLYFLIFKYGPMLGLVSAFEDYLPFLGFFKSEWVGFAHFSRFFSEPEFLMLLRNTIVLAVLNLVFFFPLPIIIALMLNEIRHMLFKRAVQTLIYIPHFLSWVVIYSITYTLLSADSGSINNVLHSMGYDKINFLSAEQWFRPLIVFQVIWKEMGFGTIIFLAALSGINPELYSAAKIDGAGRWQQLWHITLPSIRTTIVVLFILRLGNFLDSGFEQIFLMLNPLNRAVGDVFDTYIYQMGVVGGQFSYTAAVGLFKSVVSLILVLSANTISKKLGEEGIF